jgi:tryptophan synthase alpha chain
MPYLTGGYPDRSGFAALLRRVAAVADAVEIGVPFTDPMADGVSIQASSRAALEGGVTLKWIIATLAGMAPRPDTPLLLMSYLNPLLAYGVPELMRDAAAAGVCGLIIPDLPWEECGAVDEEARRAGLALVQLVTPITPPDRLVKLTAASRGFVYAVTMTGVTGGEVLPTALRDYLDRIRAVSPVPVCAGFGIRRPEQVEHLTGLADGVIVGSALIDVLARGEDPVTFLKELVGA